jgi:hypothetical protein
MINLVITVFGVLMIIAGFYSMSFGFNTPPNPLFFFLGLISSVLGLLLLIIYGSSIESTDLKISAPTIRKKKDVKVDSRGKEVEKIIKSRAKPKEKEAKPPKKTEMIIKSMIKPKMVEKPELVSDEKMETEVGKEEKEKKPITPLKKIIPRRTSTETVQKPAKVPTESEKTPPTVPKVKPVKISPQKVKPTSEESPKKATTKAMPIKEVKKPDIKEAQEKLMAEKDEEKYNSRYVKERLSVLKENYLKNAKDVESLIEERLDTFKGTLDNIKLESKEPSIIWSFDAGDVQKVMTDTVLKAEERILMMYPWIRNADLGVLKKFMETESRMIIQEASLDDDASVEIIKLLMDKNVKIRTMPHVHTVAIVSDDSNGLIISTDPIYESYEVGVVYKDEKSIEEIKRLFEEAWELSEDIELEMNS